MSPDPRIPDRDLAKGHPLVQLNLPPLLVDLEQAGFPMFVEEVYRFDLRQQWLFAQGRSPEVCRLNAIPEAWARPGPIVTNASSARASAHGFKLLNGQPASCAVDLVPLGPDGKPWSPDDPWQEFVGRLEPLLNAHGFRHFHAPGKEVWDKPHVQLVGWNDATHTLNWTPEPPRQAA
jgi:hypothetical protein